MLVILFSGNIILKRKKKILIGMSKEAATKSASVDGADKSDDYVVLDIETTGLSKYYHKITEIAAVRVVEGKVVEEFQSLVNPETHIPSFITKLTGISDKMVKDAPVIDDVMPKFVEFLGESIVVGHNATFDYGFLTENANAVLGKHLMNDRLCTMKLASRCLPQLSRRRLKDLCAYFEVENSQAHRAMADTKATVEVFGQMCSLLAEKGLKSSDELLKFEKMPIRKCHSILTLD